VPSLGGAAHFGRAGRQEAVEHLPGAFREPAILRGVEDFGPVDEDAVDAERIVDRAGAAAGRSLTRRAGETPTVAGSNSSRSAKAWITGSSSVMTTMGTGSRLNKELPHRLASFETRHSALLRMRYAFDGMERVPHRPLS
jgi:hypothetical protein